MKLFLSSLASETLDLVFSLTKFIPLRDDQGLVVNDDNIEVVTKNNEARQL